MSKGDNKGDPGAAGKSLPPDQQSLDQAIRHHDAGRLPDAEDIYRRVLDGAPDNAAANHLLGVISLQTGRPEDARDLISKALELQPDFADAHNNLGLAFRELERLDDAVASHLKALALEPDMADAHYNLGLAFEAQGRLADAEASYRKYIDAEPESAEAHVTLANALRAGGRLEEALAAYRRAIEIDPGFAEALNNLGTVEMELSRPANAIDAYRRAIAADPAFAAAHYNLGVALHEQDEFEDAIASYRKTLECESNHAAALANIDTALKEMAMLDEAVEVGGDAQATGAMVEWRGIFLPKGEKHAIVRMGRGGHQRDGLPTYQYRKYEAVMDMVKDRRVAVDIGAHVGLWSRVMALDFERVHAFEPLPDHTVCWRRNMEAFDNAELHVVALGTEEKTVSLVTEATRTGDTHVGREDGPVPMTRLDNFGLLDVDFIKVDCEGYELFALKGGEETLKRCRPVICVEQKPGHAERFGLADTQALDYLESLGASRQGDIEGDFFMSWPD